MLSRTIKEARAAVEDACCDRGVNIRGVFVLLPHIRRSCAAERYTDFAVRLLGTTKPRFAIRANSDARRALSFADLCKRQKGEGINDRA